MTQDQLKGISRIANTTKKLKLWLPDSRKRRLWDIVVLLSVRWGIALKFWKIIALDVVAALPFDFLCWLVLDIDSITTDSGDALTEDAAPIDAPGDEFYVGTLRTSTRTSATYPVYAFMHCLRLVKVAKLRRMFQKSNRLPMDAAYVKFYFDTLPLGSTHNLSAGGEGEVEVGI
eukprot:gene56974-biopygen114577